MVDINTGMDAELFLNTRTSRKQRASSLVLNDLIPSLGQIYYLEIIILYLLDRSFFLLLIRASVQEVLNILTPDFAYDFFLESAGNTPESVMARVLESRANNRQNDSSRTNWTNDNDNNEYNEGNDNNNNNNNNESTNNSNNNGMNDMIGTLGGEGETRLTRDDILMVMLNTVDGSEAVKRFCKMTALIFIVGLLIVNSLCALFHAIGSVPLLEAPEGVNIMVVDFSVADFDWIPSMDQIKAIGEILRDYLNSKTEFAIKTYELKSNFLTDGILINFIGELKRNSRLMFLTLDSVVAVTQLTIYHAKFQDPFNKSYLASSHSTRLESQTQDSSIPDESTQLLPGGLANHGASEIDDGSWEDMVLIDVPLVPVITYKQLKDIALIPSG